MNKKNNFQIKLNIFKWLWNLYKEISNYLFLIKTVESEKNKDLEWKYYRLRTDWVYNIYTVVNIPEELQMRDELTKELYKRDQLKNIENDYFVKLNIFEIVTSNYNHRIRENFSYAFLIEYKFNWKHFTLTNVLKYSSFVFLLIYLQTKFNAYTHIFNFLKNIL